MSDSKIVITADSTQIQSFGECPRLWKYAWDERLQPMGIDAGDKPAIAMGTLGHKYLERYYKALAQQESPQVALGYALALNPDREVCECGQALDVHVACEACLGPIPKPFPLDMPNRAIVKDRFIAYTFAHARNDIVPTSPDHVEIGFSEPIYEDCEHLFILEGRIDLMGSLSGMACGMDHKFQLRERRLYNKSIQVRNYAMVTGATMFVLNMIRLAKTFNDKTFQRNIASFTPEEHKWWRCELITIFKRMAAARRSGEYTQEWSSCSGKFGYECDFTPLCPMPPEPPVLIQAKKDTLYQIKPEWKPW